jgi:(p)ppGpp synthase/HD superfamily hydrolase
MLLTARYDEAILYALETHRTQIRKGSGAPYATHLISVSAMVGEYGGDEEQMIAGLLHDSIEDQGVTEDELRARFGDRVARIVVACTDSFETPKRPWRERKERYLALLRDKPADIKLVSACDKLHNARSIDRDRSLPDVGEAIWGRFSVSRDQTLWYYRSPVGALAAGWPHPVVAELDRVVTGLGG